ncbi:MAG TPA: hypothetical protein VHV10_11290 [Ktedonobacteraceae bacterium]|jgi:chromosome segregation ATPase|nr:hypothetical protein [Ktedonobacteraceae bacterium]
MEEYITRAEFEQFKKQVEQKTEEMKAIRVDVHNVDVEAIKQELHAVSNTWLETLQEHYSEHKADFLQLRESQSDFRDKLVEMKSDITSIKSTQEQILKLLQQKSGE